MAMSKPVGIDLGTTNSAVGVMNETDSEIILPTDSMGISTLPSCVWHDPKKNQVVVGKQAFRRHGDRPSPVTSIKRKMGTTILTPLGKRNPFPEKVPAALKGVLQETASSGSNGTSQQLKKPTRNASRRSGQRSAATRPPCGSSTRTRG